MSSPFDRAIDPRDPLAYAPKWTRDWVTAERRNSVRQRFASTPDDHNFFGAETGDVDEGEAIGRVSQPRLDPTILPAPPFRPRVQFSFAMAGG
jgi:hypothetical protein